MTYCKKHNYGTDKDGTECYYCAQNRQYKAEREAHALDLLANPPEYVYEIHGYDQTNVTFYKVTRVTPKCLFGAEVRQTIKTDGLFTMTGSAWPTDEVIGKETRLNLKKINRYIKPVQISWYG